MLPSESLPARTSCDPNRFSISCSLLLSRCRSACQLNIRGDLENQFRARFDSVVPKNPRVGNYGIAAGNCDGFTFALLLLARVPECDVLLNHVLRRDFNN